MEFVTTNKGQQKLCYKSKQFNNDTEKNEMY